MPFGQYQGKPLRDIPTEYFTYVLRKYGIRSVRLFGAINAELAQRERSQVPPRE